MTIVKLVKYKNYSGCVIRDNSTTYQNPNTKVHMDRAVYLTSLIEVAGKFGIINSYDGAAMSAGLEHNVSVLPKTMEAGSLFAAINFIRMSVPESTCPPLTSLLVAFKSAGWVLDASGVLRDYKSGQKVSGQAIRNEFTPDNGVVPETGPKWEQAKRWALLYNTLFNHPATFHTQIESAKRGLLLGNKQGEVAAYKAITGVENPSVLVVGTNIKPEQDLAMCVYHAHSVNAPSIAKSCLSDSKPDNTTAWPKRLVYILGTKSYGNWKDTTTGSSRYDRTRTYAKNSGIWTPELFVGNNAIMPENVV
jgi:hypothetical protein